MRWLLRSLAWAILAGWFGSFAFFAFDVAPTSFQVLPSQAAAGALVAPLLAHLHGYGMLAGPLLAVLAALQRRGWLEVAAPLVLAAVCAVSELAVTPAINEVQPHSFGERFEPEAAARFSTLHQTSRTLFGLNVLGTLGLVGLQARPAPARRDAAPPVSQARA